MKRLISFVLPASLLLLSCNDPEVEAKYKKQEGEIALLNSELSALREGLGEEAGYANNQVLLDARKELAFLKNEVSSLEKEHEAARATLEKAEEEFASYKKKYPVN